MPGVVTPPSLVALDRLTGQRSLLATGTTETGWPSWVSRPALSSDGADLAFQSWDPGLVIGDLNKAGDAFARDVPLMPSTDTDGDGIPDWWTQQYFGHATGQEGDLSRAQDDADGDGLSNVEEFLAGTIPTNAASVLALHIAMDVPTYDVTLSWGAVPGRSYQVLSTTDLNAAAWEAVPGSVEVMGNQGSFNLQAAESERYFRIRCGE
jgi:hypothetical protein